MTTLVVYHGSLVLTRSLIGLTKVIWSQIYSITYYGEQTQKLLDRLYLLDIDFKLSVIDMVINKIEKNDVIIINIINYLNTSLHKVKELLEKIRKLITEHQFKWFSYYRTLYCDCEIMELERETTILDKRFNMLLQYVNMS